MSIKSRFIDTSTRYVDEINIYKHIGSTVFQPVSGGMDSPHTIGDDPGIPLPAIYGDLRRNPGWEARATVGFMEGWG